MDNVYYSPDKFGLETVGVLDEDLSYEYHTLVVLRHTESGRVFWAEDSGCSCPTPFEDEHFKGPDDTSMCELVTGDRMGVFKERVAGFPATEAEKYALLSKVASMIPER